MIHTMCIGKAKDEKSNNVCKYKLKDFNNVISIIEASALKKAISEGKISVANLTLTQDNRLVERKLDSLSDLKLSSNEFAILGSCPNINPIQNSSSDISSNTTISQNSQTQNRYRANGMIFYTDSEHYLYAKNDTTGSTQRLDQRVHSVSYVCHRGNIHLFYTSIESQCAFLMHIIYDLSNQTVLNRGIIQKLSDRNIVLGQSANPTLINEGSYSERFTNKPTCYSYGGYQGLGYYFIPVRTPVRTVKETGYKTIGLIVLDMNSLKAYGAAYPQMGNSSPFYRLLQSINNLTGTGIELTVYLDDSNRTVLNYRSFTICLDKSNSLITVNSY